MVNDIQFSKGSLSVDLHADNVSEEFSNKLVILSIPQTSTNQSSGAKPTKILDLLRVTHQFVIRAYITKEGSESAKTIKDRLIQIANGAAENGGTITMTYDGDPYTGYLEKVVAIKEARDYPDEEGDSEIKYTLTLTFIKGVSI
jgi:hypothetical protein